MKYVKYGWILAGLLSGDALAPIRSEPKRRAFGLLPGLSLEYGGTRPENGNAGEDKKGS